MAKSSDVWTEKDISFLREKYVGTDWRELESVLGRKKETIRAKANRLGLTRGLVIGWSDEEDLKLRDVFRDVSPREAEKLFGRSWVAISGHAKILGVERESNLWTKEEIDFLEKNYEDMSFKDLTENLGRTERSIKHAIYTFGISARKRRKWSEKECGIVREGVNLSPGEVGIDRSVDAISQKMRAIRGTSKRELRKGWAEPSSELAYVLGCICSDVAVLSSGMLMNIQVQDALFGDAFSNAAQKVFGLRVKKAIHNGSWIYKGEKWFSEYYYVGIHSIELLPALGTEEGVVCGNVRGLEGEWIDFLSEKFSWVFGNDDFFWRFVGGLYDGDGSFSGNMRLAVKPKRSREWMRCELEKRGYVCRVDNSQIYVDDVNIYKCINGVLERKVVGEVPIVRENVVILRSYEVEEFLERNHYLKTLPSGCVSYGYVDKNRLIGVACFSWCEREAGLNGMELRRFAMVDWTEIVASKVLSTILKKCVVENVNIDFIRTFADAGQNHVGVIYQATNALYLGIGRNDRKYVYKDGREFTGRFSDEAMKAAGISRDECNVVKIPGKHKYVYVLSEVAREYFGKFSQGYPRKT